MTERWPVVNTFINEQLPMLTLPILTFCFTCCVVAAAGEELQGSGMFSQSTEVQAGQFTTSGDFARSVECMWV